jgi:hypothetical protein
MQTKKDSAEVFSKFSERIAKLPKNLQAVLFEDLETAVEERLKVLESTEN